VSEPPRRLDSWKEIAAYLKRGPRTVQRWEREEGLPVHRLQHEKLGSVYAYPSELDAWWASRQGEIRATAPEEASVAVLPFVDMSRDKDQAYFCEGVAEEIINVLSRLKGVRVASRTSSFQFRAEAADVREMGRRLRVKTLLEGSVRKSDSRLRIAVRLTDASSGYQMWSARYDRAIRDIFAVQDEIAASVAGALAPALGTPGEVRRAPTTDVEAYDYYLRGRSFYYRYGPRDIRCALELFLRAIGRDEGYVLAYAGVADCQSYLYLYAGRTEQACEGADAASRRAVELDPESAQAQASRALALSLKGRREEAEHVFENAIRLDPGLFEAHYFYARHAFARGEAEKAIALYEKAMEVRPEDFQSPLLAAQIYDDLERRDEAAAARRRGVALVEEHLKWNPDDARAVYMAANGLAALGDRENGRLWAERALAMRPDDPMLLYNIGCVYALLGDAAEAIGCLGEAVRNGVTQRGWFEHDSNLDPLRGDARFEALLRELP
jgi:adenylate cyclase